MNITTHKFTVLVTGTNRGIGMHLALELIKKNPDSKFLFTYLQNPQPTLLQSPDFLARCNQGKVLLRKLDLASKKSIKAFVEKVHDENWKFNAIVNNAGIGFDTGEKIPQLQWTKQLMQVNLFGTIKFTDYLLPFLKQDGRIINVSSTFGALKNHPQQIIDTFSNPYLKEQQILDHGNKFIQLCEKGDMGNWYKSAYGTSKMLLNAYSRFILKKKMSIGQTSIAMSPGRCTTDMRNTGGIHSVESGAKAVYDCIFMPNPSFDIFYHRWTKSDFFHCGPVEDTNDSFSNYKG